MAKKLKLSLIVSSLLVTMLACDAKSSMHKVAKKASAYDELVLTDYQEPKETLMHKLITYIRLAPHLIAAYVKPAKKKSSTAHVARHGA
jgi:hypothetical protein